MQHQEQVSECKIITAAEQKELTKKDLHELRCTIDENNKLKHVYFQDATNTSYRMHPDSQNRALIEVSTKEGWKTLSPGGKISNEYKKAYDAYIGHFQKNKDLGNISQAVDISASFDTFSRYSENNKEENQNDLEEIPKTMNNIIMEEYPKLMDTLDNMVGETVSQQLLKDIETVKTNSEIANILKSLNIFFEKTNTERPLLQKSLQEFDALKTKIQNSIPKEAKHSFSIAMDEVRASISKQGNNPQEAKPTTGENLLKKPDFIHTDPVSFNNTFNTYQEPQESLLEEKTNDFLLKLRLKPGVQIQHSGELQDGRLIIFANSDTFKDEVLAVYDKGKVTYPQIDTGNSIIVQDGGSRQITTPLGIFIFPIKKENPILLNNRPIKQRDIVDSKILNQQPISFDQFKHQFPKTKENVIAEPLAQEDPKSSVFEMMAPFRQILQKYGQFNTANNSFQLKNPAEYTVKIHTTKNGKDQGTIVAEDYQSMEFDKNTVHIFIKEHSNTKGLQIVLQNQDGSQQITNIIRKDESAPNNKPPATDEKIEENNWYDKNGKPYRMSREKFLEDASQQINQLKSRGIFISKNGMQVNNDWIIDNANGKTNIPLENVYAINVLSMDDTGVNLALYSHKNGKPYWQSSYGIFKKDNIPQPGSFVVEGRTETIRAPKSSIVVKGDFSPIPKPTVTGNDIQKNAAYINYSLEQYNKFVEPYFNDSTKIGQILQRNGFISHIGLSGIPIEFRHKTLPVVIDFSTNEAESSNTQRTFTISIDIKEQNPEIQKLIQKISNELGIVNPTIRIYPQTESVQDQKAYGDNTLEPTYLDNANDSYNLPPNVTIVKAGQPLIQQGGENQTMAVNHNES